MNTPATLILSSELAALGMDRDLRSQHARGQMHRVVPGVYVPAAQFTALDSDGRYRLRVIAVGALLPSTQFSRDSAAALWRLPTLGPWPSAVHAASPRASGGRSGALVRRHGLGLDAAPRLIDGVEVTSLARTLAEVACDRSFSRAVGMLDAGLRTPEEGEFRHGLEIPSTSLVRLELDALGRIPGAARARRAIDFADAASGSLGESLSRAQMWALGIPMPELQVAHHDRQGLIGFSDFYWRDLGLVGEFDGYGKYRDGRRFSAELSPEQIVIEEKLREDRLRAIGCAVVRWDWATARNRAALGELLRSRGLGGRPRVGFDPAPVPR